MRKLIAAMLCVLTPVVAGAGSSSSGKIQTVLFANDGYVIFWTSAVRYSRPACAADDRWIITGGGAMLTGLMEAFRSGKSIAVAGTGTCPGWEGESVQYFFITD